MQKKLTLRMEQEFIKKAKKYAREKGTSVSRLVANYFQALETDSGDAPEGEENLPPITARLTGILKGKEAGREQYREFLEEKHRRDP